jgi:hypothetical protein
VLHNSILISGTYSNAIEYRFPNASAIRIANNVTDAQIVGRDGATGSVTGNYTSASAALFVDPAAGDLHLKETSTMLRDQIATPIPEAGQDWDGQFRPAGATDIGADEYTPRPGPRAPGNLRIP